MPGKAIGSAWTIGVALALALPIGGIAQAPATGVSSIDLIEQWSVGNLIAKNRTISAARDGRGIHLSENGGVGIVWIEGTEFEQGTIELDVRGRDLYQRSFLGVAFHRRDDHVFESVYLRPFNFRASDPVRHMHAVQYEALPAYDWSRLRQAFPEEFENPVDQSVDPTAWVHLRVVVQEQRVQVFVGSVAAPALEVRRLGEYDRGMVGLWAGNNSDGDFANLRITPRR